MSSSPSSETAIFMEDDHPPQDAKREDRETDESWNQRERNVSFSDNKLTTTPQPHHQSQRAQRTSTPTLRSTDPRVGHFEQISQARSPDQLPDSHRFDDEKLDKVASLRTHSRKSQSEIDHHNSLSHVRTRLGLEAEAPITDEGHDSHEELRWSSIRVIFREPFAEFFGTFIMILFGNGSVAQVLLSTGQTAPGGAGFGGYQSITWGYVIFLLTGIYT